MLPPDHRLLIGSGHPLISELREAEHDPLAADRALDLLEALPALTRRRLLSTFGAVQWPRTKRSGGGR